MVYPTYMDWTAKAARVIRENDTALRRAVSDAMASVRELLTWRGPASDRYAVAKEEASTLADLLDDIISTGVRLLEALNDAGRLASDTADEEGEE